LTPFPGDDMDEEENDDDDDEGGHMGREAV
jgi:hypothetical protein